MEVSAHHYNARMTARKLRQYREVVKGLPVREADAQLQFLAGEGPKIIRRVLQSAVANAQHNYDIAASNLIVSDVVIDSAFALKRFRPASRGMAHPYVKRTAHVTVTVEETGAAGKVTKRRARRSEIEEVTAEEFTHGRLAETAPETETESAADKSKPATVPTKPKELEAYQKIKMNQQGGDVHKTHRRKSLGD